MKLSWKSLFFFLPLLLLVWFALTYIPHKAVKADPAKIAEIVIFNGNTGEQVTLNDPVQIEYVTNHLSGITLQKGKPSVGYMGYGFRITMLSASGKQVSQLIVNSEDMIRLRGFFYHTTDTPINHNYLVSLFDETK